MKDQLSIICEAIDGTLNHFGKLGLELQWGIVAPKVTHEVDLETFVLLCDRYQKEPSEFLQRFEFNADLNGVSVKVTSERVPELEQRAKPNTLDLIKSIIADRKAQQAAA